MDAGPDVQGAYSEKKGPSHWVQHRLTLTSIVPPSGGSLLIEVYLRFVTKRQVSFIFFSDCTIG